MTSRGERVFWGVDLGGTWLRVVALNERGRVVRRLRAPAVPPSALPPALARLRRAWRVRPAALAVGSTRLGRAADRAKLARALEATAPRVVVRTDLELAWEAAFEGRPGLLVLAGTGSVAYGRDSRGRAARVGGLGPLLGDDGSAFWIGREWLRSGPEAEALRLARRPDAVRAVASLAARVLHAADGRGARARAARRILGRAQDALAEQARAAARALRFDGPVPISWHGALMERPSFRRGVWRRLGRRFVASSPRSAPAVAAARLAMSLR